MADIYDFLQGGAGAALMYDAYDRLKQVGTDAKTGAEKIASDMLPMTEFRPFTVTSATGGTFGTEAQRDAQGNIIGTGVSMGLSPEEQMYQQMMMGQASYFGGQSAMDPAIREQEVYDRIRATQLADEERSMLALEERMFNQGRMGVNSGMFGGSPEMFAMESARAEARNKAALAAMGQARAEALQQQQMGLSSLGAAYLPQAQLMNVQQGSQLFPQMQQQAQLYGAGTYGETMMSGIDAKLIAEQKMADLVGGMGGKLIGGLFS